MIPAAGVIKNVLTKRRPVYNTPAKLMKKIYEESDYCGRNLAFRRSEDYEI